MCLSVLYYLQRIITSLLLFEGFPCNDYVIGALSQPKSQDNLCHMARKVLSQIRSAMLRPLNLLRYPQILSFKLTVFWSEPFERKA